MNGNSPEGQDYGQALEDAAYRATVKLEKLPTREAINAAIDLAIAGGVDLTDILHVMTCGQYASKASLESIGEAFELGALREGC